MPGPDRTASVNDFKGIANELAKLKQNGMVSKEVQVKATAPAPTTSGFKGPPDKCYTCGALWDSVKGCYPECDGRCFE